LSLQGKVAVVTGSAGGIGQATALLLAEGGTTVVLLDRTAEGNDNTLALMDRGATAVALGVDVSDAEAVDGAFAHIESTLGPVTLLVTSAAVLSPNVSAEHASMDDLDKALAVNVRGTFNCARAAFRHMRKAGGGSIVTLASQAALLSLPSQSVYTATKGAVVALTRSLAIDWAEYGIRVNSVAPTFTATPMTKQMLENPAVAEKVLSRIPLGRVAEPRDIAQAIRFLLSEDARMITGHTLPVDGGWTSGESNFKL
jgi:NAD(P)-dependent dehydrogenase (short-subunit alcohol dehydrogenase family)